MPLSMPQPPKQVSAAAEDGMRKVMRRPYSLEFRGAPVEDLLNLRVPHKVYTLGLTDIVQGAGLNDAKLAGWRYLAGPTGTVESAPAGVAEILDTGREYRFASYSRGWLGRATERAVAKAESLPQIATGKFELRMFRVPAAKIDALWLKSEEQSPDLIVPIGSANRLINISVAYNEADFLALVRKAAEQELREDSETGAARVAQ